MNSSDIYNYIQQKRLKWWFLPKWPKYLTLQLCQWKKKNVLIRVPFVHLQYLLSCKASRAVCRKVVRGRGRGGLGDCPARGSTVIYIGSSLDMTIGIWSVMRFNLSWANLQMRDKTSTFSKGPRQGSIT